MITDLIISRPLNPPAHVTLRPEHLPAPVATAFGVLQEAIGAEHQAQRALDDSRGGPAETEQLAAARKETEVALNDLAELTAASGTAITDAAGAAFVRAMGRARAALAEAENAMTEAQHAIALQRRVQPGKPVLNLNLDGRGLREHGGWQRLSIARQRLRDAGDDLNVAEGI